MDKLFDWAAASDMAANGHATVATTEAAAEVVAGRPAVDREEGDDGRAGAQDASSEAPPQARNFDLSAHRELVWAEHELERLEPCGAYTARLEEEVRFLQLRLAMVRRNNEEREAKLQSQLREKQAEFDYLSAELARVEQELQEHEVTKASSTHDSPGSVAHAEQDVADAVRRLLASLPQGEGISELTTLQPPIMAGRAPPPRKRSRPATPASPHRRLISPAGTVALAAASPPPALPPPPRPSAPKPGATRPQPATWAGGAAPEGGAWLPSPPPCAWPDPAALCQVMLRQHNIDLSSADHGLPPAPQLVAHDAGMLQGSASSSAFGGSSSASSLACAAFVAPASPATRAAEEERRQKAQLREMDAALGCIFEKMSEHATEGKELQQLHNRIMDDIDQALNSKPRARPARKPAAAEPDRSKKLGSYRFRSATERRALSRRGMTTSMPPELPALEEAEEEEEEEEESLEEMLVSACEERRPAQSRDVDGGSVSGDPSRSPSASAPVQRAKPAYKIDSKGFRRPGSEVMNRELGNPWPSAISRLQQRLADQRAEIDQLRLAVATAQMVAERRALPDAKSARIDHTVRSAHERVRDGARSALHALLAVASWASDCEAAMATVAAWSKMPPPPVADPRADAEARGRLLWGPLSVARSPTASQQQLHDQLDVLMRTAGSAADAATHIGLSIRCRSRPRSCKAHRPRMPVVRC